MRRPPAREVDRSRSHCSLVLAPAGAEAYNDGRGFYGATNDKVVTDAGFILIVFFPLFVFADEHAPAAAGQAQGSAQSGAQGVRWATPSWRGGW